MKTAVLHAPVTRTATRIRYRPDLDGLRAIAVLAVVGYHLRFAAVPGGFAGVDVFFVLSGYLICSILLSDLKRDRFSLREFYVRRIRRILPALLTVLLATFTLGLFVTMPSELNDLAESIMAAALSASNIFFGFHSSYFDITAYSRPALQTWSLGVEEQFYLVFPLLLWLLYKWVPRRLTVAFALLAVASLVSSTYGAIHAQTVSFFMPYTRAYELLIGVLLAQPSLPRVSSLLLRNLVALLGLACTVTAMVAFSQATPFPGYAALLPCLGSALLIYSGPAAQEGPVRNTMVARLLSIKPLVFIGLISYSLYLWHWPLISFQSMGALWSDALLLHINHILRSGLPGRLLPAMTDPTLVINRTFLIGLSLILATLTWLFVERPFREGRLRLKGAHAFWFAAGAAALPAALGICTLATHGFPKRFPPAAYHVSAYTGEPRDYREGTCMVTRASQFNPSVCLHEDTNRPNWLLVGDSHAAAMWTGLVHALPQVNFLQATMPACRPDPSETSGECGALMQKVFQHFLPAHPVNRIVVVGRWEESDKLTIIPHLLDWARVHNEPITMLGPVQEYDAPLPRLLSLAIIRHDPTLPVRHRSRDSALLDALFATLARTTWHIQYISLVKLTCSAGVCTTYADPATDAPMLIDDDHYSTEGSMLIGRRIVQAHLLGKE